MRQHGLGPSIFAKRSAWDYFNTLASKAEIDQFRELGIAQVTWWTQDTARARFFRPIASLVHALEFQLFSGAPWVMHIHRAVLYGVIVALCLKLLTRLSSTPAACGIACLLFAIDDAHAYSSGWISAANTLLTCIFGMLALLMHERWRSKKSLVALPLSVAAFALSLLSSEGGLAVMGYLIAYALFLEPGSWKKRTVTLIPATLLTAGYLIFYTTQHLGVTGSFDYLSPAADLSQTALSISNGVVTGTVGQFLSIPMLTTILQMKGGGIVAAALLAVMVIVLRPFLSSSKKVAFGGVGAVLSIVPFTIGMMGDRYLLWAGLGASGLLGELFALYVPRSGIQRVLAKTLLVTNTVVSLIFFIPALFWLAAIEKNIEKLETIITSEPTVVLNGHPIADNCAAAIRQEKRGHWPEHLYHLYDGLEKLTIKRTDPRTLLLTPANGWFAPSPLSRAARPKGLHFEQGQMFDLQLMTATIAEVTQDGRPRSVSFSFKRELSEFAWLALNSTGPQRTQVPAVGEEVRVNPWPY